MRKQAGWAGFAAQIREGAHRALALLCAFVLLFFAAAFPAPAAGEEEEIVSAPIRISDSMKKTDSGPEEPVFPEEATGSLGISLSVRTSGENLAVGDLADGTYQFAIYLDEGCTMPARKADGTDPGRISLKIQDGQPASAEVTGLSAGIYYVRQENGGYAWNRAVTLQADPVKVLVGAEGEASTAESGTARFENVYELAEVSGTKTWNDGKDSPRVQQGMTLKRRIGEEMAQAVDVLPVWNEDYTEYRYESSLLAAHNRNGQEYTYLVKEDPAEGYVLSQTGFDLVDTAVTEVRRTVAFRKFGGTETEWPGGTEVTLTLSAEVNGKPWDFDTNAEGKPVDAAGELLTLSRTLTRMGDDSAVWSNLRRYDEEGEPITYRVTETSVRTNSGVYSGTALRNRWTVETEGDAILNIPAVTLLQVSKIWDGEEGDPSRRPETIVYQLIAAKKDGGEVDLTAYGAGEKQPRASGGKPDYSVRWEGLPRYTRSGDEICYDVQELPVEGYSQTGRIFREKSGNVEITNTLGRNLTGFTVRKRILEQGAEANLSGYVFRLTAKDGAPLPAASAAQKNEDGEPCLEKRSDENGNVSFGTISFSAEDLQDPKNPGSYLSHRTFSYTVEEVFTDADAAHGYSNRSTAYDPAVYQIRVDVTLNGDGTSVTAAAPRYTWTAPGKISHRASFALFENELLGSLRIEKTVRTSEEDIPVGTMADGTYCFRIYTEASCRIPAKRADGSAIGAVKLTIRNGEMEAPATVDGLRAGLYYIREVLNLGEDANRAVTLNSDVVRVCVTAGKSGDEIGTHAVARVENVFRLADIHGSKTWRDGGSAGRKAPSLILERREIGRTAWEKVEAEPVWSERMESYSYRTSALPAVSSNGRSYIYRVLEEPMEGYYEKPRTDYEYDLTNTAVVSLKRTVQFENDWPAGSRAVLTLSAAVDGTPLSMQDYRDAAGLRVTLEKKAGKSQPEVSWERLPQYTEDGRQIIYSVTESAIQIGATYYSGEDLAARWTVTEQTEEDGSVTVTNLDVRTRIQVTVAWNDGNDKDGLRPAPETFAEGLKLLNGAVRVSGYVPEVTAEGDSWTVVYSGMPKYRSGREIVYSVGEERPEGYQLTGSVRQAKDGETLTNYHRPATQKKTTPTYTGRRSSSSYSGITVKSSATGLTLYGVFGNRTDNHKESIVIGPGYTELEDYEVVKNFGSTTVNIGECWE